jgi:nitroimidazol reductase NimA-like FMN-containing flavoprotein (pyridoxamine 5'-phosphate oxidase superfamily)
MAEHRADETSPAIAVLPEYECWQLLRNHRPCLGRIVFVDAGWPLALPVNYLALGTLLYFRTAPGSKLLAAANLQQVTFEIDDVDELCEEGWSVLAFGRLQLVTDQTELEDIRRRPLRPWAGGDRKYLLRMDVSVVSGRRLV